ncbi:zinc finger protein 12 isoform X2 [Anthonomus grandis grandis]|uniref:zinc finger protein 12 isoform X2 n=1 Tax=Anthonomus grandis grandis TaxID=2921223 RepID=UPI002166A460|nr:zinc finger protein 12 isoform X2 [Anthonomus grandis grandis]
MARRLNFASCAILVHMITSMDSSRIKDEQVSLNSVKIEGQEEDPNTEYTIIVQNVNEFGEVTQQIVDPSNIPKLLGDLSNNADGSVQIVHLEDGQYTYIVQTEEALANGTPQYEMTQSEEYQIIEEYVDQPPQNIESNVEYQTLYVTDEQEEGNMGEAEVYTISVEDTEAGKNSEYAESTEEEYIQGMVEEEEQQMTVLEQEEDEEESLMKENTGINTQQKPIVLFSVAEETVATEKLSVKQEDTTEEYEDNEPSDDEFKEDLGDDDGTTVVTTDLEDNINIIYECSVCQKIYTTSTGVENHIRREHSGPNFQKDQNEKTKIDQFDVLELNLCPCCQEPSETAHTRGDFSCDQCLKLFTLENSLRRHKSIEHPVGDNFQCADCNKEFKDRDDLITHTRVHSLNSIKCICGREFARKYHLERHIYQTGCSRLPKQVYECRVCGKNFTRKDYLADHLREHAGIPVKKRVKNFMCQFCKKEFSTSSLLNVHVRTHTGERPYPCDLCEKRFPSGGALKKHRRKHTGEKPYVCPECSVSFAAKETLNRHFRTHSGEKPHKCKFCGKAFIQAAQLRAHIFHHTGENAYPCPFCQRSFNRKLRLTTHIKYMHEGAEPLKCPHEGCEKTFFRKEDVNRHVLIHSNKKPFQCDVCQKSFAIKSSLKMHSNIHRKEQPVSCEVCCRAFIRKDCLIRHMRTRHRDLVEEIVKNSERKHLKSQVLKCLIEQPEEIESIKASVVWTELSLTESIKELLSLLVEEECLAEFGHPDAPADKVLESVITRCGHQPADRSKYDYIGRMRANTKLLFTVVIDDASVKELLKRQSVDEVIVHVLTIARKQAKEENASKESLVSKREVDSEPEMESQEVIYDPDDPLPFSDHELEMENQEEICMSDEQQEMNSESNMRVAENEDNSLEYAMTEESL